LTDAILGAAGLGSIGDYFPSSDPAWRGADSAVFLQKAAELAATSGLAIGNADVLVIAEAPRLAPHVPAIRDRLAGILGVPRERLSIRGTSSNGLGFVGRGEGLVAMASVLLTAS
jgi:2-C-methyl-D-erythritol 2,4-cyclodiphosphate synthase